MTDSIWKRITQATGNTISIASTKPLAQWFGSSHTVRNHSFEVLCLTLPVRASKNLRVSLQEAGHNIERTLSENLLHFSVHDILEVYGIGTSIVASILTYLYELYVRDEEPQPVSKQTLSDIYPQALEYESTPLESLELSLRAYNCLRRFGYETLGDLCTLTPAELQDLKNIGQHAPTVLERVAQIAAGQYTPVVTEQSATPNIEALPSASTLKYLCINGRLELCLVALDRPETFTILQPVPGMTIQVREGKLFILSPES